MRTVRCQGLTFRITQPHGLRLMYLLMPPYFTRGEIEYSPERAAFFLSSDRDLLTLTQSSASIRLAICNDGEVPLKFFLTQEIS